MLIYNDKINENIYKKTLAPKPQPNQGGFWRRFLRYFIQFATTLVNTVVATAINAFLPGAGIAAEFALNTLTDLGLNAIFNKKIDWKEFAFDTTLNAIPFVLKGFKYASQLRKFNKPFNIADNIKDTQKAFKRDLKKSFKDLGTFATKETDDAALIMPNYQKWESQNLKLIKNMNNLSLDAFEKTAVQSKNEYKAFASKLRYFKKIFVRTRTIISLLASPRYAGKKAIDVALKRPRRILAKKWNDFLKQYKRKFIKPTNDSIKKTIKHIPISSQWLNYIRIIQSNNPWDLKTINAILYFQKTPTKSRANPKGKEPVFLYQKNAKMILNLIKNESPGKYYLNNFAWGWTIGKFIRQYKMFITMSKIPLFSSLLGSVLFTIRTVEQVRRSITQANYEYSQGFRYVASEFFEGVKENSMKGWHFKGLTPAISLTRSVIQKRPFYVMQSGMRVANKQLFYQTWKNGLSSYTYKPRKATRARKTRH